MQQVQTASEFQRALGVLAGVALANVLPERALRIAFACVTLVVAAQLLRRSWMARRIDRNG